MLQHGSVRALGRIGILCRHITCGTITFPGSHHHLRTIDSDLDSPVRTVVRSIGGIVAQGVLVPELFRDLGEAIVDVVESLCVIMVSATTIRKIFKILRGFCDAPSAADWKL